MNAPVARVLSAPAPGDGEEFVANGVEFLFDGRKHSISTTTNGEVILSAG